MQRRMMLRHGVAGAAAAIGLPLLGAPKQAGALADGVQTLMSELVYPDNDGAGVLRIYFDGQDTSPFGFPVSRVHVSLEKGEHPGDSVITGSGFALPLPSTHEIYAVSFTLISDRSAYLFSGVVGDTGTSIAGSGEYQSVFSDNQGQGSWQVTHAQGARRPTRRRHTDGAPPKHSRLGRWRSHPASHPGGGA